MASFTTAFDGTRFLQLPETSGGNLEEFNVDALEWIYITCDGYCVFMYLYVYISIKSLAHYDTKGERD